MKVKYKLKQYMLENNITIYYLSISTGISYELLRRVFNGNRTLPSDELIKIAIALDYDLNLLK